MKKINNFIRIPSDYLEAKARIRIPGRAAQVLEVIERKTFGWHKNQDGISFTQFKELTGINYIRNIRRSLNILKKMKIINFKNYWGVRTDYEIQKNYDLWKTCGKACGKPVEKPRSLLKNENSTVLKNENTQKKLSKETIKRDKRKRKQ